MALRRDGIEDFTIFERGTDLGRRVAGQPLPRRRLRRALLPLLVHARAAPRLDAAVLAAAGDPGLPARDRRQARGGASGSGPRPRSRPRSSTRGARRWRLRTTAGERARGGGAGGGLRPAQPAQLAGDPRPRGVRRPRVPLGRVGPRLRPGRQARGGGGHRRQRGPVRAPGGRARSPSWTSTSARRRGCCRAPTTSTRAGAGGCCATCRACRRSAAATCWRSWSPRSSASWPCRRCAGCSARGPRRSCACQLRDPELRRKLWPDYPIGCKRVLFSSHYLPALQRANVEVVTDAIERITPPGRGRRARAPGGLHRLGHRLQGQRVRAADARDRPRRAASSRTPGPTAPRPTWASRSPASPSMYMLYGPNTNLGVGSIIEMIEAQVRYVSGALRAQREARRAAGPAARDPAAVGRAGPEPAAGLDLDRVRQLVPPGRRGPRGEQLARLHVRVPQAHARVRSVRVRRSIGPNGPRPRGPLPRRRRQLERALAVGRPGPELRVHGRGGGGRADRQLGGAALRRGAHAHRHRVDRAGAGRDLAGRAAAVGQLHLRPQAVGDPERPAQRRGAAGAGRVAGLRGRGPADRPARGRGRAGDRGRRGGRAGQPGRGAGDRPRQPRQPERARAPTCTTWPTCGRRWRPSPPAWSS